MMNSKICMLSQKFSKLCRASSNNLDMLLADALATGDRDSYLVFLDLLEEIKPMSRIIVVKSKSLEDTLYHLTDACPRVIDRNMDWKIFRTPTFGGFNKYLLQSPSYNLKYDDYAFHDGKMSSSITFYNNYPIIAGEEIWKIVINPDNSIYDIITKNWGHIDQSVYYEQILNVFNPIATKGKQDLVQLTGLLKSPSLSKS